MMLLMSKVSVRQEKVLRSFDERKAIQRLLIPVKSLNDAIPSIAYAIRRAEGVPEGVRVQLALLHVEPLVAPWPVRGHGQYAQAPEKQGAGDVFAEVLRLLEGLDIEFATYLRSGPIVFSILDVAEQLDCSEIVVPAPGRLHFRFLSRNIVTTLMAWQRSIPVIAVTMKEMEVHGLVKRHAASDRPPGRPLAVTAQTSQGNCP
jgi:nucleotide-binding universal stress UspA family protein